MVDHDDDDDRPTERIEQLSDEDWQTIRASLAVLGPAVTGDARPLERDDEGELPTMRLEAAPHESTIELTVDTLPVELRSAALPFVEAHVAPPDVAPRSSAPVGDDAGSFARIVAELERGETALRDAYDDAFLAKRAAHRGAFELGSVASLCASIAGGAPTDPMDIADALRVRRVAARRRATA